MAEVKCKISFIYHRFTPEPAQLKPLCSEKGLGDAECDQVDFKSCANDSFKGHHTSLPVR